MSAKKAFITVTPGPLDQPVVDEKQRNAFDAKAGAVHCGLDGIVTGC